MRRNKALRQAAWCIIIMVFSCAVFVVVPQNMAASHKSHDWMPDRGELMPALLVTPGINMILETEFWWDTGFHGTDMPVLYNDGTFVTSIGQTGTWMFEMGTDQLSMVFDLGQACDSLWVGVFTSPSNIEGTMSCQNGVPAWGTWIGAVVPATPTPSATPTLTMSPTTTIFPTATPTASPTPVLSLTPTLSPTPFSPSRVFSPLMASGYTGYFSGPWELEPNNSYLSANGPLKEGVEYLGYPDDARDYFSLYIDRSGQISINLLNHTGQGTQLQLFYASVTNRVAFQAEPPYHIQYSGADAGIYYIYIYSDGNYNQNAPYTVQVDYP